MELGTGEVRNTSYFNDISYIYYGLVDSMLKVKFKLSGIRRCLPV